MAGNLIDIEGKMWWQELDDPTTPEQLCFWARTRARGRYRYLCCGILGVTLIGAGILLTANVIGLWLLGKGFDLGGFLLLPAFAVSAWFVLRERWGKNEERYSTARGRPDSSK